MPPIWFTFPDDEFDNDFGIGGVLMILFIACIGAVSLAATVFEIYETQPTANFNKLHESE